MKTFNPVYFNHGSDSMFIPANPTLESKINPNVRDNVMTHRETTIPLHRDKWYFNRSTGQLESPFMMPWIEAVGLNDILAKAWKNHGRDAVKGILLYLDPNSKLFDDCYPTLRFYKFERRGDLEVPAVPQLCFVGPARRWSV
jgi:hypothetical protein